MAFVPAVCPKCGGDLQVPDDRDVVACMYCRANVIVRQAVRLIQGNISNLLEIAEAARTAGNHAEAIGYYNRVLENDTKNSKAWLGKGTSVGWSSTLADFRFQEMVVIFENAIKNASDSTRAAVKQESASSINSVAMAFYQLARNHAIEHIALHNTWAEYLIRCQLIVSALEAAHAYDPEDKTIIKNVIHLCKDNIEGIAYSDPYDKYKRKLVHLSNKSESELRELMAKYVKKLQCLDPAYKPPQIELQSAGCFVVTATFGDPNHRHVRLLQAFRDTVLQNSWAGRIACRIYYRFGPDCAALIERSAWLRALTYCIFVLPSVLLARSYFQASRRNRRSE